MHWFERKFAYSVGFGVLFALVVGAALFVFARPGRKTVLKIGYGEGAPVRKDFLEKVAEVGHQRHLEIKVVTTKGTDDTLSLIHRHEIDLGLVAGAIEDRASRDVLEVMPLYMEPLQLLVKGELFDAVSKDFGQLRGKTIDLDTEGSATHLLSDELLKFIGLSDPATGKPEYKPVFIPQARLEELTHGDELPDAVFQLTGLPSPVIRHMIVDHNYRLVALPFGSSFNLDRFRDLDTAEVRGSSIRLDTALVEEFVLPAFAYSVLPAVPAVDTRTIAARLTLVGRPDLSNDVVARLLESFLNPEVSALGKPPLTIDLLHTDFQFERHPGTDAYVSDLEPVDVPGRIEAYGTLVEIWGLVMAGFVGAGQAWKWWRARRGAFAGRSVGDFLNQVLDVEAEAHAGCSEETRVALDQRLSDIKKHVIGLHIDGKLEEAEDFPTLMVTLADTRTRIWHSPASVS